MSTITAEAPRDGYALAYREARMGLEDQERSVVERGQTLVKHDISASAWIAIGCFVLLGFAVLMVLWPRRDWEFSLAPDQFISWSSGRLVAMPGKPSPQPSPAPPRPEPVRPSPMVGETRGGDSSGR
jgi:hypothetical protein